MKAYQKLFASYYDIFMRGFEKRLYKRRKELLSDLEGNVLGVGEGTGVNFQFYPEHTRVFSVEPSKPMLKKAKEKAKGKGHITFYNYGINDQALDKKLEPKSMDAIVCTLVLCTISDPSLALENFKKWLKPNGKLIILEHIHASKPINKALQNLVNPVWKVFGDGCNLNRNTDELIKAAGFEAMQEAYFKQTLRFHAGIFKLQTN